MRIQSKENKFQIPLQKAEDDQSSTTITTVIQYIRVKITIVQLLIEKLFPF